MDDRIGNKREAQKALFEALKRMEADLEKMQARREQKLWKEINVPCGLSQAISRLTKDDMDRIRKAYEFKNISQLKKQELPDKLADLIPPKFKDILFTLDEERYTLIRKMVENKGIVMDNGIEFSRLQSLIDHAIAFPGIINNQRVLVMPSELVDAFQDVDGPRLQQIIHRNTEWVYLTQGMLYYYGVMPSKLLMDRIEKLTGKAVDIREYIYVLSSAMDYYEQIRYSAYGYSYCKVYNDKKIVAEQKSRPDIDYYPFTKAQLLKAGVPGHIDRTPQLNGFISLLADHYDFTDEELNGIAQKSIDIINGETKSMALFEYLKEIIEFPSFDMVQQLMTKITELHNNTRMWILKGHTPSELFREEKKHLKPLPSVPYNISKTDSKVINIENRLKVGRNDPCPCGSGKKYKKCCGK